MSVLYCTALHFISHYVTRTITCAAPYPIHDRNTVSPPQFVENECEVLPSKERCPYLVVAEMIEQPFTSKSEEIYTQGAYVRIFIFAEVGCSATT